MIRIENKSRYITIVACSYYLLRFINCFLPTSRYFILLFTVVEALSLLLIPRGAKRVNGYFYVAVFNMLFCVLAMLILGSVHINELVLTIFALGMGYYLAKCGVERKHTVRLFVLMATVLVFRIIVTGSVNAVFFVASRNNISAFSILASVLLYSTYNKDENLPYIPAFITLLLSCVGEGRGGVISSAFLMLGVLVINMTSGKNMSLKRTLSLFLLLCIASFIFTRLYDVIFSEAFLRLTSQKLIENERVSIFQSYYHLAKSNTVYMLFGVPMNKVALVAYLNGNFHNSFLSLHNLFGLFGVMTIVWVIIKSIVCNIKSRNWILILIILTVLMRISTDSLCFVGYYDSLFYYLIFLSNKKDAREATHHDWHFIDNKGVV